MKKFVLAICVCMAVGMMVVPASAEELYDFHLRGISEGLAAGAVPPPGFYFVNDIFFAPQWYMHGTGNLASINPNGSLNDSAANSAAAFNPITKQFQGNQIKLNGVVDAPALLWNPGCKFLGADYMMAIIQPFDWNNLRISDAPNGEGPFGGNSFFGGSNVGTYNTIIVPYKLSWKIPCDLRISTALAIGVDDAWTSPKDSISANPFSAHNIFGQPPLSAFFPPGSKIGGAPNKLISKDDGNAYAWAGNGAWSFNPEIGISWLHAGWNISAQLGYTFWTKDGATNYQSGGEFFGDYTATYTCGKWTFGVGAQTEIQTENDKFNAIATDPVTGQTLVRPNPALGGVPTPFLTGYTSQPHTAQENYSIGPILGYNFGPCSITMIYNFSLGAKNDFGGDWFDVRLVVPLGNPYGIGK